jgi:hypothetical protein
MIKVTFFETLEKLEDGHTYYVDTSSFVEAYEASRDKAKALGVDLARHSNSAMALIDVLKIQAL